MPKEVSYQLSDKTLAKLRDLVITEDDYILNINCGPFFVEYEETVSTGKDKCIFVGPWVSQDMFLQQIWAWFADGNTEPITVFNVNTDWLNRCQIISASRESDPQAESESYTYTFEVVREDPNYGLDFDYNIQQFVYYYIPPR